MARPKEVGDIRMTYANEKPQKRISPKTRRLILRIAVTVCLGAVALTMMLPFAWMLSSSLKYESDVFTYPVEWIPRRFNAVNNYREVWGGRYSFLRYYLNSIKVTVITTFLQGLVSVMGAYAFAKLKFKFRDGLFILYLSMMMIPDQVTIVPKFLIFRNLGLYNTHLGLILVGSFSVYGMFLLKQFMMGIPDSLCEAAKIDGANHLRVFLQIIVPISTPAIATLAVLKFVWTWNDYQNPLIFISSEELYTIPLGMTKFMTEYTSYYSLIMVASVCAILPLVAVFLAGQKYVMEGMTAGAVKG
jgi:multiple sugar transport system permease protein